MAKLSKRALRRACEIIEAAENRTLACDGPVGSTVAELTPREADELCKLLKCDVIDESLLRSVWKQVHG